VSRDSVSTVGPAALESFALQQLPDIAEMVARGDTRSDVAQAVGVALLRSLPCHGVEVASPGGSGEDAVLFSGQRRAAGEAIVVSDDAGDGHELQVRFISKTFATAYRPLVQTAAALIRAAGRTTGARHTPRPLHHEPPEPPRPPSVVAQVCDIYAQAAKVATSRVSVLIQGESGTGKELLARYIHTASDRAAASLVTLNCAALPRDLLESELFGVERGVATGVEARIGKFEAAHGGTLLLDEIGDMAPETQAKILRVLQEHEVYRVGGHTPRPADVRILAATNRDIEAMLEDGGFRSDLYHRIADWVVHLPPLRARRADIPNLAAHFLAEAGAERGVHLAGISRSAVDALVAYDWPGNVRQLEREIARAALFLEDGELLDTSRLQERIVAVGSGGDGDTLKEVLERAERDHIVRILAACNGAVAAAAERLQVGVSTLYRRMKTLGIE
jgi:DNA-binding NtrC family response regulator